MSMTRHFYLFYVLKSICFEILYRNMSLFLNCKFYCMQDYDLREYDDSWWAVTTEGSFMDLFGYIQGQNNESECIYIIKYMIL